jgi:transposase
MVLLNWPPPGHPGSAESPFYPKMGRPSIDPELMVRMLIIGYVFAIRSERPICRDVQVNLAYRWFCGNNGLSQVRVSSFSVHSLPRSVVSICRRWTNFSPWYL